MFKTGQFVYKFGGNNTDVIQENTAFIELVHQTFMPIQTLDLHSVTRDRNVCSGWPVYEVECLCSRGRGTTPTSISIFDFYDMMTL